MVNWLQGPVQVGGCGDSLLLIYGEKYFIVMTPGENEKSE